MILFIYGEEGWLIRQKLQQVTERARQQGIDATNSAEFDGQTALLTAVAEGVQAPPFLAEKRLVVIRNWLTNRPVEESDQLVEALDLAAETTIIVVIETGTPDKRRSAFKKLEKMAERTWHMEALDEAAAVRAVQRIAAEQQSSIHAGTARQLVQQVGTDLWRLHSEVSKLAVAHPEITPTHLAELVTPDVEGNIFSLVDGLGQRNLKRATTELQKLLSGDEPPLRLLAMVVRQFRLLIAAKSLLEQGATDAALVKQLAVRPFLAPKLRKQSQAFASRELRQLYEKLQQIDTQLKLRPTDPEATLQLFVADVCVTSSK